MFNSTNITTLDALRAMPFRKRQAFARRHALCKRVAEKGDCSVAMASMVLSQKASSARVESVWNEVLAELAEELAAKDAA